MKILYHHRLASKDGQYVHVEELTTALRERGHELLIVGPSVSENSVFGSDGGIVKRLKQALPRWLYEVLELCYSVVSFIKLRRAVASFHPDVLYERYSLFSPAGVWIKKRYDLPLLLEVNAPLYEERSRFDSIALHALARWSERYVWRHASAVLPVTQVLADKVRHVGVPPERISVVRNGIDPRRFENPPNRVLAKQRLGLTGECVVGFTGFVREWNGLESLVQELFGKRAAFSASHQVHLLIVGDGPARTSILAEAARIGAADRVTVTGVVKRNEIVDYLSAFDVAVIPDVVDYASPLKLAEYLAAGLPVIAPRKPNILEVLTDRADALLFEPGSASQLGDAVEALVRSEPQRTLLGTNGRALVDDKGLTWQANARRVGELAACSVNGGTPEKAGLWSEARRNEQS